MGATAKQVLDVARSWLGFNEKNGRHNEIIRIYNAHKPLARGYKMKSSDAWCDCFISACAIKADAVDIIGTEVGVQKHIELFKKLGIWIEDGKQIPEPGDIVVFSWRTNKQPNNAFADHIGFVERVNAENFITIEGNIDDAVGRRVVPFSWGYIRGFARPRYTEEKDPQLTFPKKDEVINKIAREVILGKWGNGFSRKRRLEKAGHSYALVQKEVNRILRGEK